MPHSKLFPLLRDEARRVLRAFLAAQPGAVPTAVGFVFALDNITPQLDLCAHLGPLAEDEEERWNSGDYDFPAGLTGVRHELGPEVWAAVVELHQAARTGDRDTAYRSMVTACEMVLLDLQGEGVFPPEVDLNVSEVGDPPSLVASRYAVLRERIEEVWGRTPRSG